VLGVEVVVEDRFLGGRLPVAPWPNMPEAPPPVVGAATTSAVLVLTVAGSVESDDVEDAVLVVWFSDCASKAVRPWSIMARYRGESKSSVAWAI
jgi:hypothetical protein